MYMQGSSDSIVTAAAPLGIAEEHFRSRPLGDVSECWSNELVHRHRSRGRTYLLV